MAVSSSDRSDKGILELKVFMKEIGIEKPIENVSFHIFVGYSNGGTLQLIGDHTYLFRAEFDRNVTWNENLCYLSINITEKTANKDGQVCSRNVGDVSFKIVELFKTHGKKNFQFEKAPIYNHCLDDEIYTIQALKDPKVRRIGYISGNITINILNAQMSKTKVPSDINATILDHCIKPWYDNLEKLAPNGPVIKEIYDYHVPIFRFLSGSMVPFSYSLLWKNRYYDDNFEQDPVKCQSFVKIIQNLLDTSVFLHPEFKDTHDFIQKCTQHVKSDSMDSKYLSCVDVIINMLNIKTASEPYIADIVDVPSLKRPIQVDQMSNVNNIYGCDCEDGAKYACELKRLICDSNWNTIIKTMDNNRQVIEMRDTVVRILRMMCAFMTVMYCENAICHVVTILIDWKTTKKLLNIDLSTKISKYEEIPSRRLTQCKMLFVETTSYSSPFQLPLADEAEKNEQKKMYYMSHKIEQAFKKEDILKDSIEVYAINPTYKSSGDISSFYKYFTNFMTWELMSVFPNTLDFLPVKSDGHYGFSLNDFAYNMDQIHLVPRMTADKELFKLMNNLILSQLPSYDIFPDDDVPYFSDIITDSSPEIIAQTFENNIKSSNSALLTGKYQKKFKKDAYYYARMNIYAIDLLTSTGEKKIYHEIIAKIEEILGKYKYVESYDFRVKRVYSYSKQTIVVNVFFYYKNQNIELKEYLKEYTPQKGRQRGRK